MQIKVDDPLLQTTIFAGLLGLVFLLSGRRLKTAPFFSISVSNELKGLAILAVIFGHVGFFLSQNNQFLFPLSAISGVGVNLFLFLSGFGLTVSGLNRPLSPVDFYRKRLSRIFLPLWLVMGLLLTADFFLLGASYPITKTIGNFLGWYPTTDIFRDLDSPLWYFSLILFYYLIFPWLTGKRLILISPLLILLAGWLILQFKLPVDAAVFNLYKLHFFAFPLGMAFAGFSQTLSYLERKMAGWVKVGVGVSMAFVVAYTAIHSGVGEGLKTEQFISLITMFALVLIFLLKNIEFKLLSLFGQFSYEIYLIHWPLLYRYDMIYKYLPPFLGTLVYLGAFLVFGFALQKVIGRLSKRLSL